MLIIRKQAFARAGLVGNPSDGYHGQTISFIIRDFAAQVILYEWDEIEILGSVEEKSRFNSIQHLARDVKLHGYYGGVRLVKATIRRFFDYCSRQQIPLHERNFSIRYESQIPRQVGLAGSSAIIVATLRCLMEFYGVAIPLELQPSLALSVETEELGIAAGLQDRVIQIYEGLVYMNFGLERMREQAGLRYGVYERLDPSLLPPVYVAYGRPTSASAGPRYFTTTFRYPRISPNGEPAVVEAMTKFASLAAAAREALQERDAARLSSLMDRNFDTRRSIYQLPHGQVEMIECCPQAQMPVPSLPVRAVPSLASIATSR